MLSKATDCRAEQNIMTKILSSKLVIMLERQKKKKKKNVFYEGLHTKIKIWSKEVLLIKKVKILYHGYTSSAISTNY